MGLALAFGIGIVAGLRSLTAPAAVSWAAHLGWLDLQDSRLGFMGSTLTVVILSLAALFEYVSDLLPTTPRRTLPGPLVGRMVLGGFSGACLTVAANQSWLLGAVAGAIGGLIGAAAISALVFGALHATTGITASSAMAAMFHHSVPRSTLV